MVYIFSLWLLWRAFGLPWADFDALLIPLGTLWVPFGRSLGPFGRPLRPFGSLWSALGLPVAALWTPFGHSGTNGACLKLITNIYDYRREELNLTSKPMILGDRGENPSKILAIDYREMCQIHETVFKNKLSRICPLVPAKWCHEVLLGPPFHTRRGSG